MEIFGFKIERNKDKEEDSLKSFVPEIKDDGAVIVSAGGTIGSYIDLDGTVRTEAELVTRYREMSNQPEIDKAINEITNEAIVCDGENEVVDINIDRLQVSPKLKDAIRQEFSNTRDLLDFKSSAYDVFNRWYVDGRLYYHVVVNEKTPQEGIKELRYIDPRKIRKIREVLAVKDPKTGAVIQKKKEEYFFFSAEGLNYNSKPLTSSMGTSGMKILPDSIIHCTSGLTDSNNTMVLSYIHSAIKPLNQLRSVEDATLIYHLTRAPERRAFYIDTGGLPRHKAEEHVRDMMTRYKNKISYDAQSGEIRDARKFMTFTEDYWFPRTADGKTTEVQVIAGGAQLSQLLETVEYFQNRLYRSLQVPMTRLKPDSVYNLGRATEITRDEVNFSKFIDRLRNKFSQVFLDVMEKQLVLKRIATPEDWKEIKKFIHFDFNRDIFVTELKEQEILRDKLLTLESADVYAGKYYSHSWIRKNILRQSENEIEIMDAEMQEEMQDYRYNPEFLQQGEQQADNSNEKSEPESKAKKE